jgi:hypothetical protein
MYRNKSKLIFVCPQNAVDEPEEITLESVKAAFGITEPAPSTETVPETGTEPTNTETPPADPPNPDETNPTPPANTDTPPVEEPPVDKSAQMFAQMRVQNKQYQKIISGVAKILGVQDTSNPEALTESLNSLIIKAEAKKNNIPEDVYQRLQFLEEKDQVSAQQRLEQNAYLGFQNVKTTFKLDDAGLNKFAQDLRKAGLNPFETPIDLVKEYRNMNFDSLIQSAVAEGIRQEAERAAKAQQFSSTPSKTQGQGGTDPEKINTVAQLTSWFDKQNIK